VFTLHGIDQQDRPMLRTNLRRAQLIPLFKKLPATVIAIEACSSSHHWAHELTALGHEVHLIPPQYVKPYVKRGKNDRNDAEAICEAAGRPGMHFAPAKSVKQRAQGMVLKVRETLIGQRVALVNTVRGHAAPACFAQHLAGYMDEFLGRGQQVRRQAPHPFGSILSLASSDTSALLPGRQIHAKALLLADWPDQWCTGSFSLWSAPELNLFRRDRNIS
jgi:transposase